jgi:hypothetical protein
MHISHSHEIVPNHASSFPHHHHHCRLTTTILIAVADGAAGW